MLLSFPSYRQICIKASLNLPFGSQQILLFVVGKHLQWRHRRRHRSAYLHHLSDCLSVRLLQQQAATIMHWPIYGSRHCCCVRAIAWLS